MPDSLHPYRPAWPAPAELFVAPDGDEKYSGRFARPNGHNSDGPLPDLACALHRLRESPPVAAPITVWMAEGTYALEETLRLDSGTPPVRFQAMPGARVVISAGKRLTGFRETKLGPLRAWVRTIDEVRDGTWWFRSLYVNGASRSRPRLPRTDLWRIASVPGMRFDGFIGPAESHHGTFFCEQGQVSDWKNLTDVEAVAVHYWMEERLPLAFANPETGEVRSSVKPWFPLKDDASARNARFWFENVGEALGIPGEWYLDRAAGTLTYLPMEGESLESAEIIAPRLDTLVRIEGDSEATPARGFEFVGITFAHVDWRHIPGRGTDAQAAVSVPGMVQLRNAAQCAFVDCRFGPAGPYGLEIGEGCCGNRVAGCTFSDLGAGGLKLIGNRETPGRCSHTVVEDNEIAGCTRIFPSAVGILVVHADHVLLRRNHIHHLEYSGISCGWVWGFGENPTHDILIEDNHIHHLGTGLMNDMGGIYTLGEQPGTVIRGNHIHDIVAHNYGGWGIYCDEGSSYLRVEKNLIHHASSECFNLHYGRGNLLLNNVFAFSGLGVLAVSAVEADQIALLAMHNVLVSSGPPVLVARDGDTLAQRGFRSDLNLLWSVGGDPAGGDESRDALSQVSWKRFPAEAMRALGYDTHSVCADPGFADLAGGDYRVNQNSPLARIGFEPFTAAGVPVGFPVSDGA